MEQNVMLKERYLMAHKTDHSPKSQKEIFVGYPLDQPLCYKVLIRGSPH